ncbi:hypothetical protein F5J12DRAFT_839832 [Pisolithus orientalis]|uniref:uncharacterized protein n=1 Tax=Pisolithus orientalis TaxID=936130 RepID=UPI0022250230|nr:uncharacterized protein F5J12DRAFT_839832 [Pisolithus orientalis]KAI6003315.1 hypothetical protein F5J12DRAFT_839832 [Pisolithus orientalis]
MTCNPFKSNQQSNAAQDLHSDVVLPLLRRRCQILCAWRDSPRRYTDEKQKVECESNSIQQTLGAGLLEGITTTFGTASYEHENLVTDQIGHKHDRQLDIPSMVQEINVLQGKVDATEDDDEKRALEEDLTGKILWLCWCGICAEANQALPKVVDFIWKEGNIRGLWEISAIMDSVEYIDRDDNQTHMQRIMRDAGAGTSKHRLLLAARAAEQAKWSQSAL